MSRWARNNSFELQKETFHISQHYPHFIVETNWDSKKSVLVPKDATFPACSCPFSVNNWPHKLQADFHKKEKKNLTDIFSFSLWVKGKYTSCVIEYRPPMVRVLTEVAAGHWPWGCFFKSRIVMWLMLVKLSFLSGANENPQSRRHNGKPPGVTEHILQSVLAPWVCLLKCHVCSIFFTLFLCSVVHLCLWDSRLAPSVTFHLSLGLLQIWIGFQEGCLAVERHGFCPSISFSH